jgi:hypothetical protein
LQLTEKIKNIITGMKALRKEEEEGQKESYGKKIVKLRQHLVEAFDLEVKTIIQINVLDRTIKNRLDNKIDSKQVFKILDKPLSKGGAGLDQRMARKLARRLELIILGKL